MPPRSRGGIRVSVFDIAAPTIGYTRRIAHKSTRKQRPSKDPNVRPSSRVKQTKSGRRLHWLFELAIFVKGVDGALETIGGLLIFALLDMCVSWFIWREYLARKAGLQPARSSKLR